MRMFHKDCLPDGRMPSRLPVDEYDELTAAPLSIPDGSRPFYCICTELVGGHAKNEEGKQRFEDYWELRDGTYLRLFHHKTNKYDKLAISVFLADSFLSESSELGHIPRADKKIVFEKFKEGLLLEARVTHLKEWYKLKDVNEEHPQYDVSIGIYCYPGLNAPFDVVLYSRGYLSDSVINEFLKRGWNSPEAISATTDRELRSVKGVGPKALARLRALFPSG